MKKYLSYDQFSVLYHAMINIHKINLFYCYQQDNKDQIIKVDYYQVTVGFYCLDARENYLL